MTNHTQKRWAASVTTVALAASLAACSSDSADDTGAASTTPVTTSAASTPAVSPSDGVTGESASPGSTGSVSTVEGTYSASGSYQSPGGEQSIDVSITLGGGLITAVTVTPNATDSNAAKFQSEFAAAISGEVVGKSLADAQVTKVSGSSLTGAGFNEALEQIAAEAGA